MDPQTYSTRKTNGRWTQEEHDKFILGIIGLIQVYSFMARIGKKSNN